MYLKNPAGDYPRFIGDLQIEHPDWVFGDSLPNGWLEVADAPIPDFNDLIETVYEIEPAVVAGILTRQFAIRDLTVEEIAARLAL